MYMNRQPYSIFDRHTELVFQSYFFLFFVLCIQNLAVTPQTLSIRTWICSQTSCHIYFLVQISSLIFFTKMFCLKHQHFIIYSIQIFIFFFIVFFFISDHCCSRAVQILIFQTSVQNYSIIATAFKILRNWKLNLLLYERNLNMYKYFIHIGVDPLDLILQQIIDSDV